jgi:hypothetical protein
MHVAHCTCSSWARMHHASQLVTAAGRGLLLTLSALQLRHAARLRREACGVTDLTHLYSLQDCVAHKDNRSECALSMCPGPTGRQSSRAL